MKKDNRTRKTPQVGEVWKHRYNNDKVFITQDPPQIVTLEENGVFAPINTKDFLDSFCFVGKSKINFKDLFEVTGNIHENKEFNE